MARLFTLGVDMVTRTSKFTSGMNKAGKSTKKFRKGFKTDMTAMKTAFAGLIAAVGVGKLVSIFNETRKELDLLIKTASKLGVVVQDLQRMRFAGERSGVEIKSLDVAVQRFTRRLSEATRGTGEAVKAFEMLGLNAEDLQRMSLPEQFKTLADAFAKVSSQGDRVAIAFKLFDTEGVNLVNVLNRSNEELQDLFDQADKFKGVFTESELSRIEGANDSIANMNLAIDQITNRVVLELAPAIGDIASKLADVASNKTLVKGIVEPVSNAVSLFEKLLEKVEEFEERTGKLGLLLDFIFGSGIIGPILRDMKRVTTQAERELDTLFEANRARIAKLDSESGKTDTSATDAIIDKMKELEPFADRIAESVKTPLEKFIEFEDKLIEAFDLGLISMEQFTKALEAEQAKLDDALGVDEESIVDPIDNVGMAFEQATDQVAKFEKASRGLGQEVSGVAAIASKIFSPGGLSFGGINQTFAQQEGDQQKQQTNFLQQIAVNTRNPVGVFA